MYETFYYLFTEPYRAIVKENIIWYERDITNHTWKRCYDWEERYFFNTHEYFDIDYDEENEQIVEQKGTGSHLSRRSYYLFADPRRAIVMEVGSRFYERRGYNWVDDWEWSRRFYDAGYDYIDIDFDEKTNKILSRRRPKGAFSVDMDCLFADDDENTLDEFAAHYNPDIAEYIKNLDKNKADSCITLGHLDDAAMKQFQKITDNRYPFGNEILLHGKNVNSDESFLLGKYGDFSKVFGAYSKLYGNYTRLDYLCRMDFAIESAEEIVVMEKISEQYSHYQRDANGKWLPILEFTKYVGDRYFRIYAVGIPEKMHYSVVGAYLIKRSDVIAGMVSSDRFFCVFGDNLGEDIRMADRIFEKRLR